METCSTCSLYASIFHSPQPTFSTSLIVANGPSKAAYLRYVIDTVSSEKQPARIAGWYSEIMAYGLHVANHVRRVEGTALHLNF